MADLSNVPPEILQIMTHDPPYSEGEKALLQSYAGRPDANPVVVRAFQNLGALPSQIATPTINRSSDLGIPGLDIPDNIAGIGLPTADFMSPSSASAGEAAFADLPGTSAFHEDLQHKGAGGINFDKLVPSPGLGGGSMPPRALPEEERRNSHRPTLDFMNGIPRPTLDFITPGGSPNPRSGGDVYIPAVGQGPPSSSLGGSSPTPSSATGSSGIDEVFNAADPANTKVPGFGAPLSSPGLGGTTTTDWAAQRDLERSSVPSDSVFANIPMGEWDKFAYLMANPNLLAGKLYEGTPTTAAMATPMVGSLAELARNGLLQPGDQMSQSLTSDLTQARMVEDTINSMRGQMGADVSPRAIYQEAFRRALNTPTEDMYTGQGEAGDISNQISVTNGYLLLAQPFISQGQQEFFQQKLDRWAQAYAQQYVNGDTDVSYPQWLSDHGAGNLLGG